MEMYSSMRLTIVAMNHAKLDQSELVKSELLELVKSTRAE
jgi:hypothetical protein